MPAATPDFYRDLLPDAARVDVNPELTAVLHGLAVQREHQVPGREAGFFRGLPGSTSDSTTPASMVNPSASAMSGVMVCVLTPISPRRTRPVLPDLGEHVPDDVARSGEAYPLAAP